MFNSSQKGQAMRPALSEMSSGLELESIKSIIDKPLGHIHCIMFWSSEQRVLYKILGLVLVHFIMKPVQIFYETFLCK